MRKSPVWLRRLAVGGATTLAAASGASLVGLASASATPNFNFTTLAGPNRYGTAVAIANQAFPHGVANPTGTVIVASGVNFPDALAASYLAGNENGGLGAPILLTDPTLLSPETQADLATLKAINVVIVGGTAAVSAAVATAIAHLGYNVTRIAGTTRFDTAQDIDTQPAPLNTVGQSGGVNTAILATGDNFPDALGAGALAYHNHFPLILTDGNATTLSTQAINVLTADNIKKVVAVGGSAAINAAQLTQLKNQFAITVDNPAGNDRSLTSVALAEDEIANYGFTNTMFNLANGYDPSFAASAGVPGGFSSDALAGSELSGQEGAPTLITDSPTSGAAVIAFAQLFAPTEASGFIFGGTAAISPTLASAITAGARTAAGPVTVTASPASIVANGASTSTITVTVLNPNTSAAASNDSVTLTTSAGTVGSCGVVTPSSGNTNSAGQLVATYTDTFVAGSCTITAKDATYGNSGSATVTETGPPPPPPNQVLSVTASPQILSANGTDTSTITATVTSAGTNLGSDPVIFKASPSASCGTLTGGTSLSTTHHLVGKVTAGNGQATLTYQAATLAAGGTCTITTTEDDTGATNTIAITQDPTLSLAFSPSAIPANGSTTSSITTTVTHLGNAVQGIPVKYTETTGVPPGACGTLNGGTSAIASNQVPVTYKASSKIGFCPITATTTTPGVAGSVTQYITQTQVPAPVTSITSTASLTTFSTDGGTAEVLKLSGTVTSGGVALAGDPVLLSYSGTPTDQCGPTGQQVPLGVTGLLGVAHKDFPIPATNDSGTCVLTLTEADGGETTSQTITFVQALTAGVTTASIPANTGSTTTLTATVLGTNGLPVDNVLVQFILGPFFPGGACGALVGSPLVTTGGPGGVASITYKASGTVGSCIFTASIPNANEIEPGSVGGNLIFDTGQVNQTG